MTTQPESAWLQIAVAERQSELLVSVVQSQNPRFSAHSSTRSSCRSSRKQSPVRSISARHDREENTLSGLGEEPTDIAAELNSRLLEIVPEAKQQCQAVSLPPSPAQAGNGHVLTGPPPPRSQPVPQFPVPLALIAYGQVVPLVEGPSFPDFTKEDRAQYIELRMCLESLLHESQPEAYKYAILLRHVKAPRAHSLVLAHAQSNMPYTESLEALDDRYGRPWEFIIQEIKAIEQLPQAKDDRALDDLSVRVQSLVGMPKALKEDGLHELHCSSNVERILSKLPKHRQERFRRQQNHRHSNRHGLSLDDLSTFLRDEVRNLSIEPSQEPTHREREKKDSRNKNRGGTTTAMHNTDSPKQTQTNAVAKGENSVQG